MNMRLVDPLGERVGPSPADYPSIGEYLRALREHKGLALAELAEITRIRTAYLQGIEDGDRSALPARPFAIGYVRSYALALGIDGDAAAARVKRETPEVVEPFRDPVGVAHEKPKRSPLIIAVVALLVSGVVLWNIVQRAMVQEDRETSTLPAAAAESAAPPTSNETAVAVGAATPAPAAQNLPEPYKVPGLDAPAPQMKNGVPVIETASAQTGAAAAAPAADMPAVFKPEGAVYGAPASAAAPVVLLAKKPASLIVRGGGGAVYFARQLAAGEAYRAPQAGGLTAEVSDPAAFVLYVAGANQGMLVSQQTALDKLAARAPAPPPAPAPTGAPTAAVNPQPAASPAAAGAVAPPVHAKAVHRAPVRRTLPEGYPYEAQPAGQETPPGEMASSSFYGPKPH